MHGGDCGVGIDEDLDQAGVVVHLRIVGDRVDETLLREEPRRRRGHERVADDRQGHRNHEHVPHEVEVLIAEDVQPDQERRGHHEVAVHVHVVGEVDDPAVVDEDRLQIGLEEGVQALLEGDHVLTVDHRLVARAIGDAADGLVAQLGQHEEAELLPGVRISMGEPTTDSVDQ